MKLQSPAISPRCAPPAYGLLIALIIAAFAGICILEIRKNPLRMDEVDYFQSMHNVIELGLPLYYAGEVDVNPSSLLHLSTRQLDGRTFDFYRFKPETGILKSAFFALSDGHSRYTWWMFHPPLYVYLGSLFLRVVPLSADNSSLLRYFNLIFSAGVFAGMVVLSRELYPQAWRPVMVMALLLFISNRMATAGSVLIDYNATLAPCVATWWAVAWLRSQRRQVMHLGLGILTALAFFTGLGIGLSLVAGLAVYIVIAGRVVRPWHSLLSVFAGTVAFLPAFLLFCQMLGLPFSQPFLYNWQRSGVSPDPTRLISGLRDSLTYAFTYSRDIGHLVGLFGLVFFGKILITREAFEHPARAFLPITVIVGFLLQGSLRAEAYGFPKYILFLLPLLFVFIAGEATVVLHDSVGRAYLRRAAIVTCLTAILMVQAILLAEDLRQPGATIYLRGELGVTQIAQQTRILSGPADVILSPKDVAFFAGRKFVEWNGSILTEAALLNKKLGQDHIHLFAARAWSINATSGEVSAYLKTHFAKESTAGDFLLFRARTP